MNAVLRAFTWALAGLACLPVLACAQAVSRQDASPIETATPTTSELEKTFFAIVRDGDALQFLAYVPEDGVNLGHDAKPTPRAAIEDQLTHRTGLYCKLFDSGCIAKAAAGVQPCSYRELLTHSEKARTASTETTRNNVRQAILVAEVQNQKCGGAVLIDFIFNYHQAGWKLFSIP